VIISWSVTHERFGHTASRDALLSVVTQVGRRYVLLFRNPGEAVAADRRIGSQPF